MADLPALHCGDFDTLSLFSSVLLIEDDAAHAKLIQRALEGLVGEVICAPNGEAALRALETNYTELVFCDLHLPDIKGVDLLKTIREVRPTLPVIVMTASSNLDDAVQAMREGAWDYMVKQFSDDLHSRLKLVVTRMADARNQQIREQQVRAERDAFWSAVHTAQDGLAILGAEGHVVFSNEKFADFQRVLTGEHDLSQSVNLVIAVGKHDTDVAHALRKRLYGNAINTFWSSELAIKPEGPAKPVETRHFELSLGSVTLGKAAESPATDEIPRLRRFVVWVRDITRRKEQEKFQRDLLSTTTHDLKNPLGAILTSAELLESENVSPEKKHQMINSIASCARNSISIIDELLSARRIQDGVLVVKPRNYDLADFLDDMVLDFLPMAKSKSITFSAKPVPEGAQVYADKLGVIRILSNLVSNAIKFTPRGGKVELSAVDNPHSTQISVTDTGAGIEPSERHVLFEKYARLEKHREIEGTGLGLFVAKNIIDAHGGRIEVESEVGVGTTFVVTLPKQQGQNEVK